MNKEALVRQDRLYTLAQEDLFYRIWNRDHEKCKDAFYRFYDSQPEAVQYILNTYVECGFVAANRLVDLACEHMIFPDEK